MVARPGVRTVLVLRTRWGRIVDHDDSYADTARIEAFERELSAIEGTADGAQHWTAGGAPH